MKVLSQVGWYVRALFGETAYDEYLAHHRAHCSAGPALTRREFERLKTEPNVRCC
jgi:uncharacterized short protein YbdD (DUF466 family)